MNHIRIYAAAFLSAILAATSGFGSKKADLQVEVTVETFREASKTADFFENAYGYAVFPTIGKGGFGIGGAHGTGRVYKQGEYVGETSITQVTIGFQIGGQAYSQIIFFEDERAFDEFTNGEFEFGAQASAVAITAGAQASAGSTGTSAGASTSSDSTHTREDYYKGMAVFTYTKGGLMYEASLGGQKFKYKPKK